MISIGGSEYTVTKARFRKFIILQQLQESIEKNDEPLERADLICQYVALGLDIQKDIVLRERWKEVALAYVAIMTANILTTDLIFMKSRVAGEEDLPWDYPGRDWYAFAHIFAKEYGWTIDYTADLEVEDALKLLQEILVSGQMEREWQWDLSEKSVGYDPTTKKSRHIDLPKPNWMIIAPKPPKMVKIHKGLIPQGLVIKLDGSHATNA